MVRLDSKNIQVDNMVGLGFCSMGGANHPVCWSHISHQTEVELVYTLTFYEMQKAALALLTANVDKDCKFSTCPTHLLAQLNVQIYMKRQVYKDGKLTIDQTQCDDQAGWHNFSMSVFGKLPNVCSNHLSGNDFFVTSMPAMFLLTTPFPAGIAAANTSHVKYFDGDDRRDKYNAIY